MPVTGLGAALVAMGEHRADACPTPSPHLDTGPTPLPGQLDYITYPPGFAVIPASEHTAMLWKLRPYSELRQCVSSAIDGLLGGDFLGHFTLTLDYNGTWLQLTPTLPGQAEDH
jgi:hypothetical protein